MRAPFTPATEPSIIVAELNGDTGERTRACLDPSVRISDASSGDAVISLVEDLHPDVLLLDPTLTTSDGQDVHEVLLAEATESMPIVVLTSDSPELIERGLQLGAFDYIDRPLRDAGLRARLEAAMRLKRLRDEVLIQRATLDRLTRVDPLTGLANRIQTEIQFQQMTSTARRHDRSLAMVLMDLDHFTHINEIGGNEAGDMVLQDVARHVMSDIRTGDMAGRWDGDQFMLLLPETDRGGAGVLAERLRLTISEFGAELPDGTMRPISASFAFVQGNDSQEMLRDAATCLKDAKRNGGNCTRSV